MTRNLLIATLFLLGSTLLLGYIWVREHYVLSARAARFEGTLLAHGAADYEQYCASCHGLVGEGGVSAGAPRINNLLVTLREQNRLDGPNGILAKYGSVTNFVQATVTSGVRGTAMPAWSNRFGGALRDDQIRNIVAYVSSWWDESGNPRISADAQNVAVSYRATAEAVALAQAAANTPFGRGQVIFSSQCSACHQLTSADSTIPAPGLGGKFSPEGNAAFGTSLPNGKPATPANFFEWVRLGGAAFADQEIQPNAGHGPFIIQAMPAFPNLTDEQLADLLAFISAHDRDGEVTLPSLGPDGQPLPEQPAETPASE
jgi:mono/diheme cytochrome c family protein